MDKPDRPVSNPADISSTNDEELRRALQEELLQDGIEQKLAQLDPTQVKQPPKRWQQVLGIVMLILVLGLLTWGFLAWRGLVPSVTAGLVPAVRTSIHLTSTDEQHVMILVGRSDEREVKLLDTVTGEVRDVSRGDTHASHAALSPKSDVIAYVSTDSDGSALYLININGGVAKTFDGSSLDAAAHSPFDGATVEICEWSDLLWSPEGDRLAFFVCSLQASALFVVPAQAGAVPLVVEGTKTVSKEQRDAFWLEGDRVVLTSGEKPFDSLTRVDLAHGGLKRLYGPLK